jgi:hypothetical protein
VQYRVTGVHPTGLTVAGVPNIELNLNIDKYMDIDMCNDMNVGRDVLYVDMGMGNNLTLGVDMDMAMKNFNKNADRIPLWQYAWDMLVGV